MIGAKLIVLSALRHEPSWIFHTFLRNARGEDIDWFRKQKNVHLYDRVATSAMGWNVKPTLLKLLLSQSGNAVLWCDSDIIISRPISPLLNRFTDDTLIATEEYCWGRQRGNRHRTQGFGLKEARALQQTVNTCLLRVSTHHLELLNVWEAYLSSDAYVFAQSQDWSERPLHLMGDQDVLTALIASTQFGDIKLHLLRNGRDIAQCFQEDGYTAHHRLINAFLRRTPQLVHAQGGKPWKSGKRNLGEQLSPYSVIASEYVYADGLPNAWIEPEDTWARFLRIAFFGEPNLTGLLPAALRTSSRVWRRFVHFLRSKMPGEP